ncbi:Hypothetical predicted protein [Paramuricea clavata]|uniref:HAT C-terminal dimerisation domain-containing protein n=1 Tax=Paramuricea clavata TaxID=317549 RepID=A0A7D9DDA8_PARCT|nr:Hypothetical predicted protein [Paramuricea clavata]
MEKFELEYWPVAMVETKDGSTDGIYSKIKDTFSDRYFEPCLHEIYLGLGASATFQEIEQGTNREDVEIFLTNYKNFMIESIVQIQKRFDLDAEYHQIVECLSPHNAAAIMPRSLWRISQKLPYLGDFLDVKKLDVEWRQQAFEENASPDLQWDDYWKMVRDSQTASGEAKYPNLMGILASLPFSNCAVEHVFSQLKLVKTDHRSRLKSTSLISLLRSKMAMKNGHYCAASLKPSKRILELASAMKLNATDEEETKHWMCMTRSCGLQFGDDKKIAKVLEKFDEHCEPRKNVTYERHIFYQSTRNQ